jgi:hypothetical protein
LHLQLLNKVGVSNFHTDNKDGFVSLRFITPYYCRPRLELVLTLPFFISIDTSLSVSVGRVEVVVEQEVFGKVDKLLCYLIRREKGIRGERNIDFITKCFSPRYFHW